MDHYSAYASPHSNDLANRPPGISSVALSLIASTQKWVRFSSILLTVIAAFVALYSVVVYVRLLASTANASVGIQEIGLSLLLLFSLGPIYLAFRLSRYAKFLKRTIQNPTSEQLAAALQQHRSFWKTSAILQIGLIILSILTALWTAAALGL